MKATLIWLSLLGLVLLAPSVGEAQVATELDAFWAEMARTVKAGDFEGYSRLYHPDAVLVSLGKETSYPIADALARWKQGFDDTRDGKADASVAFRITERFLGETTAHETGMFRYGMKSQDGEGSVATIHFESLLVKKDGAWLLMMEYQKQPATDEEWEAAK
jgi:ketosteroid isomerase-like protein